MKIKSCKKFLFVTAMVVSLSTHQFVFAQGGYQQPVPPPSQGADLYDQVLEQKPVPSKQQVPSQGFEQPSGYGQPVQQVPANTYNQRFVDPGLGIGTPTQPLKGRIVVVPAGTMFDARLATTISSEYSKIGDSVIASVSSPGVVGQQVPIPAGSQLIGQVVNAIPAKRFKAGAGGILEIRFTTLQTPDGQTYPISASVDETTFKLQAGTGGSRLAKGAAKTAAGAGIGAALGTALGAIAGGKEGVGRGAWSGAAIGGGLGVLSALAGKGGEIIIDSGFSLPIKLDQSFQAVVK